MIDADNPVVRLCAAGMAIDGDATAAIALFTEAWAIRRDDYDASIAAHYLARHQPNAEQTLHWNRLAVQHAEAVPDDRAAPLLASLYLNLGDSYHTLGDYDSAATAACLARSALENLPADGYRAFLAHGIDRLQVRIDEAPSR